MRHETQILGDWAIDFLEEQPEDQPFCLQVSFNATHAEDGDKRLGIGHYPWPKVTDGMYEDQRMPLPRSTILRSTKPTRFPEEVDQPATLLLALGYRGEVPDQYASLL